MSFRAPITTTKEDGMAVIEVRTVAQIAECTSGTDLEQEYADAVEDIGSKPELTSLHTFATLAAVAVARVRLLEAGR